MRIDYILSETIFRAPLTKCDVSSVPSPGLREINTEVESALYPLIMAALALIEVTPYLCCQ